MLLRGAWRDALANFNSIPRTRVEWATWFVLRIGVPLVLLLSWDSASSITRVRCPILLMSASNDQLVPSSHARTLASCAIAARTARPPLSLGLPSSECCWIRLAAG